MRMRKCPMSRKLLLLLGDIGIVIFSYCLATALVLDKAILIPSAGLYSGMLPIMIVIVGLLFNINGLYSVAHKRFAEISLSLLVSMGSLCILMMAISFFIREFSYSRSQLILSIGIQFVLLLLWRHIMWRIERSLHEKRKVLLIGNKTECMHVYNRMVMQPQLNLELKYVCTDFKNSLWKEAAKQVEVVIICSDLKLRDKADVVHYCNMNGKMPLLIPNAYEVFCSGAELDKIDDIPVFRPQSLQPSLETRSLKRILDITVSGIGFICAVPFMLATIVAMKILDPGPLIYSQVRTGLNEKAFKVYKFRTMRVDAEKYSGPVLAQDRDPRITCLGRFLRAVRLDELPQIWNVLIGDMSIVGPRPERPFFVEKYKKEISEYIYRHNVKPGITGLAQVYGKYNTTAYDKLIYDLTYIQNCNILNDLTIIVQTVRILFTKSATEGVRKEVGTINLSDFEIHRE